MIHDHLFKLPLCPACQGMDSKLHNAISWQIVKYIRSSKTNMLPFNKKDSHRAFEDISTSNLINSVDSWHFTKTLCQLQMLKNIWLGLENFMFPPHDAVLTCTKQVPIPNLCHLTVFILGLRNYCILNKRSYFTHSGETGLKCTLCLS